MSFLSLMFFLAMVVCGAIFVGFNILSVKSVEGGGSSDPFECGFDPLGGARVALSLRFFVLVVLFLVFDVEIVLILPLIIFEGFSGWYYFSLSLIFIILILGLGYEWSEGSLSWCS
uniref:NADH-ubiquinone oxidoreductase chain 3 n=1 Tax=Sabella spallanzanii TaxID=85702 RepID=A0A7T1SSQ5_SABSP|nr:NADH dehydrogenase subunit 3 [Sabella spallanzanii]QPO99967.1 NADH dehydrogenase subunit 3 [Sabella spallanzanii]UJM44189.1 NADH dehydrogenase subunit 3 [Sabella spallanzanii]UYP50933.1 NADH dehydrogenase subunit 3 [Sabella spallanzanii]